MSWTIPSEMFCPMRHCKLWKGGKEWLGITGFDRTERHLADSSTSRRDGASLHRGLPLIVCNCVAYVLHSSPQTWLAHSPVSDSHQRICTCCDLATSPAGISVDIFTSYMENEILTTDAGQKVWSNQMDGLMQQNSSQWSFFYKPYHCLILDVSKRSSY